MRPERPRVLGIDEIGDAELVARIASGEEASFAIAFERHSSLLFGSVVRFLGDREAAADVVQETYLSLWRRATQFNAQSGTLAAWLLGIARNRSIDRLRAEARRPPLARRAAPARMDDDGREERDPLDRRFAATDADDPARIAARRWVQSVVRTSVSELGEPERQVLTLAYSEGLSQSEIAARLGCPLGTVKSRSRRAMAHLRTRLAAVPDLVDAPEGVDRGTTASGRSEP
jgi:RNA polymerase sigma factor (sigma-70 family)